ncbi:tigger transposable element-derived protein 4-like [Leguminivora glycinivorella]|uniref:tigger transposable element-derived protein 4-like n=1 Tax=Leguminivora glycinivorella TaxID=1035111 RepID=UPI00200EF447|nr:tigger transposable element-derived protein 4-like [Leguminivora glycinivorella]
MAIDVADLQLPVSTLRTIIKKRDDIKEKSRLGGVKRNKLKVGKFEKLENVLVEWLHQARALNLPISGPILCEKARKIAENLQITDFTESNGWIDRFKNRHGIVYRQISGESETVAESDVDTWLTTLPALIQNYEPRDIFNADEFGLFFKLMPDKSYVFKGETCHGGKASKERLTVLACANSDGSEKLRLLVIGKAKNPRCFKNVRSLPVKYDGQSRAWMTGNRFVEWLKALDDHFQVKCRQIILFIDNCPAHPKGVELKNIKLVFLPPNATSKLQPMDQGIIKVLKQGYRARLIHRYLMEMDDPDSKRPLNVHDAILNISAAWQAIKPETIQNCFKKAGFRNDERNIVLEQEEPTILQDFPGYSSIDDNVATHEVLSVEDLIESVDFTQNAALSDDDDANEQEETPILSNAQALSFVADLRRYVSSMGNSEDAIHKLNYIENLVISNASKSLRQSKINNYFK